MNFFLFIFIHLIRFFVLILFSFDVFTLIFLSFDSFSYSSYLAEAFFAIIFMRTPNFFTHLIQPKLLIYFSA